jgi:thymidine kinase
VTLSFFHGPMDCGKSTLALQIDHNQSRQGRHGLLLVRHDRSGPARITSRLGLSRDAIEVTDGMDLRELVVGRVAAGSRVDYIGRPGRLNARVVGGRVVRAGDTVLVADTGGEADVHYQVLCRAHHRSGDLGPGVRAPGQLTIS